MTDQNTFAEWLYNRMSVHMARSRPAWRDLTEEDRSYWEHEAQAVGRAYMRGGYKDYTPDWRKQ